MKKELINWYSYQTLTTSKNAIKWKIYIHKYMKVLKNWKGHKANEFEFCINSKGEIIEVRNVKLLISIFR